MTVENIAIVSPSACGSFRFETRITGFLNVGFGLATRSSAVSMGIEWTSGGGVTSVEMDERSLGDDDGDGGNVCADNLHVNSRAVYRIPSEV